MKTILQRITNLLEADGIHVSAVETYPPEEDGMVSVSLRVQPLPVEEETVINFIEDHIIFDNSACEDALALYQAYMQTVDEGDFCVSRIKFMRIVKKNFPECQIRQARKPDGKTVLIFSGIRFNASPEAEMTEYSCDRQKAEETRIRKEAGSEALND